jgi:hypothetical protein
MLLNFFWKDCETGKLTLAVSTPHDNALRILRKQRRRTLCEPIGALCPHETVWAPKLYVASTGPVPLHSPDALTGPADGPEDACDGLLQSHLVTRIRKAEYIAAFR